MLVSLSSQISLFGLIVVLRIWREKRHPALEHSSQNCFMGMTLNKELCVTFFLLR